MYFIDNGYQLPERFAFDPKNKLLCKSRHDDIISGTNLIIIRYLYVKNELGLELNVFLYLQDKYDKIMFLTTFLR